MRKEALKDNWNGGIMKSWPKKGRDQVKKEGMEERRTGKDEEREEEEGRRWEIGSERKKIIKKDEKRLARRKRWKEEKEWKGMSRRGRKSAEERLELRTGRDFPQSGKDYARWWEATSQEKVNSARTTCKVIIFCLFQLIVGDTLLSCCCYTL